MAKGVCQNGGEIHQSAVKAGFERPIGCNQNRGKIRPKTAEISQLQHGEDNAPYTQINHKNPCYFALYYLTIAGQQAV